MVDSGLAAPEFAADIPLIRAASPPTFSPGGEKESKLLRCKSAASHHTTSRQPVVSTTLDLLGSVINPPEEAAGA